MLIRDLKDEHYPFENEYKDFKKSPRWKEYAAFGHHPLGLECHVHKYFAYIDTEKKEWDFTKEAELVLRMVEDDDDRKHEMERGELVKGVWDFFPRNNQGYYFIDGLVRYADIAAIDEKGDVRYEFAHLYVDFSPTRGPFSTFWKSGQIHVEQIELTDYKRIQIFPDKFQKPEVGKIHKNKKIKFDSETLESFKHHRGINALYDSDGRYSFLKPRDVISIANVDKDLGETFIQITHKFEAKITDYLERLLNPYEGRSITQQLGREPGDSEKINIYEFKRVYEREFDKER